MLAFFACAQNGQQLGAEKSTTTRALLGKCGGYMGGRLLFLPGRSIGHGKTEYEPLLIQDLS